MWWGGQQQQRSGLWPPSSALPSLHERPTSCRVLQLFLSRTAQRGPHLSSGHLLWRLGLLLLLVLGFLAMWTVGVLERSIQHTPLVTQGRTLTGRHFYLCHHDRWDYIMVVGELLLLSPTSPWPLAPYLQGPLVLVLPPCAQTLGPGPSMLCRDSSSRLLRWCHPLPPTPHS